MTKRKVAAGPRSVASGESPRSKLNVRPSGPYFDRTMRGTFTGTPMEIDDSASATVLHG